VTDTKDTHHVLFKVKAALLRRREVFRLESVLSQDVIHWNAFAALLNEPALSLVKATLVFLDKALLIIPNHHFEQLDHGSSFAGPSWPSIS